MANITIGDRVMVSYPPAYKFNNPAKRLNGREYVVKSVHHIRDRYQRVDRKYYELYGAESKFGVSYAFLEEDLVKL